jgi:hypothetical protein
MGCTASSQAKTTAQSPPIAANTASNTASPGNDDTPANASPKQENQVQPLATSNPQDEPAKQGKTSCRISELSM